MSVWFRISLASYVRCLLLTIHSLWRVKLCKQSTHECGAQVRLWQSYWGVRRLPLVLGPGAIGIWKLMALEGIPDRESVSWGHAYGGTMIHTGHYLKPRKLGSTQHPNVGSNTAVWWLTTRGRGARAVIGVNIASAVSTSSKTLAFLLSSVATWGFYDLDIWDIWLPAFH